MCLFCSTWLAYFESDLCAWPQAALGLTGVEGVFRTNCESVLKVLQSNKEVLLMLLQV